MDSERVGVLNRNSRNINRTNDFARKPQNRNQLGSFVQCREFRLIAGNCLQFSAMALEMVLDVGISGLCLLNRLPVGRYQSLTW